MHSQQKPTKLSMGTTLFCFVFISFFSSVSVCTGEETLTLGKSISGNQTIISAVETFALGFFSPGNSTNRYLGIWYNKISEQTVVWVANRETPLTNNSDGILRLNNEGNLVIVDGRENVIWSSNVLVADGARENLTAVLMYSGNLVLKNSNETILWQSFDYPGDTLLPGVRIGLNLRTGHSHNLTSWRDYEDPEPGLFTFSVDRRGPIQLVVWKKSEIYIRGDVWDGSTYFAGFVKDNKYALYFTLDINDAEWYLTFSLSQDWIMSRLVLSPIGNLEIFSWDENNKKWVLLWWRVRDQCNTYGWCGAFGICDKNSSLAEFCKCLTGFRPNSQRDWDMRNWSGGCVQRKEVMCNKRNGFLRFGKVKVPDHSVWFRDLSMKECETTCLRNCSCTAYAYSNVSSDSTPVCLNWAGKLMDTVERYDGGGMDLYVRVEDSELGNKISLSSKGHKTPFFHPRSWRLWVLLVLCITLTLVSLSSIIYCRWIRNLKQKEKVAGRDLLSFDVDIDNKSMSKEDNEIDELWQGEKKDVNLPLFTFTSVVAATDNFSAANKLGEGGFGPVYKGKSMKGQEVAVKRLSKMSGQGNEEFKNEIALIAKLQHRNLVRLLGCCIEGEERILIYEYMPNKSLDSFLFDPSKSRVLDWGRRIHIIEGIAQGLLYLHQHSILRIIHRDLKASNILLDGDMNPKISDFGMARIFGGNNESTANTKRIVGTYGYMSPEYAIRGLFSTKSDVFSFGVLLLEILSGKKSTVLDVSNSCNLLGYAWELWRSGRGIELLDRELGHDSHLSLLLIRYIHVALLCVQENAADRPNISDVLSMLSNELMVLPSPKQVAFLIIQSPRDASSSKSMRNVSSINDVTNSIVEAR